MCRWLVWCSEDPILLAEIVLEASNSLLRQSFDAGFHPGLCQKNNMTLNADGFGVGWYGRRGAAIYRSVTPAWNNRNLRELCGSVESRCIFAHVRAATPSSIVSEENCHPFRYGPLLFQHNGHVEDFPRIKRRLMAALRDDVYEQLEGTTDSEACFGLVLSLLDPEAIAANTLEPSELQNAMLGAIAMLREMLEQEGIETGYSTFNFALTDGQTVVVTRYCDKAPRIPPPSLYYAFLPSHTLRTHISTSASADGAAAGPAYGLQHARGAPSTDVDALASASASASASAPQCRVGSVQTSESVESGAFICASEPLTRCPEQWTLIEENSMLCYSTAHGLLSPRGPTQPQPQPATATGAATATTGATAAATGAAEPCGGRCSHLRAGPVSGEQLSEASAHASQLSEGSASFRPSPYASAHASPSTSRPPASASVNSRPPACGWSSRTEAPSAAVGTAAVEPPPATPPLRVAALTTATTGDSGGVVESSRRASDESPRGRAAADRVSLTPLRPGDLEGFLQEKTEAGAAAEPWRRRFVISALASAR